MAELLMRAMAQVGMSFGGRQEAGEPSLPRGGLKGRATLPHGATGRGPVAVLAAGAGPQAPHRAHACAPWGLETGRPRPAAAGSAVALWSRSPPPAGPGDSPRPGESLGGFGRCARGCRGRLAGSDPLEQPGAGE